MLDETFEILEEICAATGMKKSTVISALIIDYKKTHKLSRPKRRTLKL